MKKLSSFFHAKSTGITLLISTGVFLLFGMFVLPNQAEQTTTYAGDAGSVDLSFFLTADAIYEMAEIYGPSGRAQYIQARLIFDSIFPLIFGSFLILCSSYFLSKAFSKDSWLYYLNLLPFLGVIFDYCENFSIVAVMANYPDKIPFVTWLVTIFTPLKWIFVTSGFLVILIGLFGWLVARLKNKKFG